VRKKRPRDESIPCPSSPTKCPKDSVSDVNSELEQARSNSEIIIIIIIIIIKESIMWTGIA
jgi:hypothetical protein